MQILNENSNIPECPKSEDGKHKFITIRSPNGNQSGWHEEGCEFCGKQIGYDSSD